MTNGDGLNAREARRMFTQKVSYLSTLQTKTTPRSEVFECRGRGGASDEDKIACGRDGWVAQV